MIRCILLSFLFVIVILFIATPSYPSDAEKVVKVEVTGNERIDTGFIMNKIKTKEGDPYDLERLREDMKEIYRTGFFSDVQIDVRDTEEGKAVTFVVIERPPIKAIYLSGNKKIKTATIQEKLKVKTGTVFNPEKVKESIEEIKKHYISEGYYAVKIGYEVEYDEDYEVVLKFMIEEPQKAYVKKIGFIGNKALKADKLKGYMRIKERGVFSWFTGSGILDEDLLEEDRKILEAAYSENGYVRASIGKPEIKVSRDGKSIEIIIPVEEGALYNFGTIDFSGDLLFKKWELAANLRSKLGNQFRSSTLHEDVLIVSDLYQDRGYAFCEVTPLTSIDDESRRVDITLNIKKGEEIYINRVNIFGNARTRDKVIRRELRLAEGDRFSGTKLKESKRRLNNTTYFNVVDMKLSKTEQPDMVNLDIAVEERQTGSLSLGLGYSTAEDAIVTGNISQENFLGTGRKLYLDVALSSIVHEYTFTFVEPYIRDMNLGGSFSLYNYSRIMDSYDYEKKGGYLGVKRPFTDYVSGTLRYNLDTTNVTNIEYDASRYIKEQEGTSLTSSMFAALTKNTIDDKLNPRKGIYTEASLEVAGGPFAGDNDFYRLIATYGEYIPLKFWESTFFVKGTIGTIRPYAGKKIPIQEKFYIGGIDTIRGFKYGEAGPLDENEEPIGGEHCLYFNTEWIFPIYKDAGLRGVIFLDSGGAFDDSKGFTLSDYMKAAAGAGIRWLSPFGPIRIEMGFNLFPKRGERKQAFDFSMGRQF